MIQVSRYSNALVQEHRREEKRIKKEEMQTCLSSSCSVKSYDSKEAYSIMYFQMFMSRQAFLKHNRSYLQQKAWMNKKDDIKF